MYAPKEWARNREPRPRGTPCERHLQSGTGSSNLLCSSSQSVSTVNPGAVGTEWPIEEAFRGLQIGRPEPLGEGAINRRHLANATLTASQSSEARGGPQLPRQSAPSARDIQGLAEWSSTAIVSA